MTTYPEISKGLGKLTPELWRRMMVALQWYERVSPMVQLKQSDRFGGGPAGAPRVTRPWVILDSTEIVTDRKWSYEWIGGRISGSGLIIDPESPTSSGEGFGSGLNLMESSNGSTEVSYGVPVELDTGGALASIVPLPIPVGAVVFGELVDEVLPDGKTVVRRLLFMAPNALIPTCEEVPEP